MKNEPFNFKIFLRSPKYPVVVVLENELYSAYNIEELAEICFLFNPTDDDLVGIVIDSTGDEFQYLSEHTALMPDFLSKKWTKKKIIELFNESVLAKELATEYPMKSISNKKMSQIVGDICGFLNS